MLNFLIKLAYNGFYMFFGNLGKNIMFPLVLFQTSMFLFWFACFLLIYFDFCHTAPTNDTYPTETKPLVLFKDTDFQGNYLPVAPDDFKRFAYNLRSAREMEYKSLRVLHNRTVVFARNIIYTQKFTPGSNIPDIPEFMIANPNIANGVWYNYDMNYEVDFHVKVELNPGCFNCSVTGGVCYTGSCVCRSGFTGELCDVSS